MTPALAERRRSGEISFWQQCRIRSEAFVAEVGGGRRRPPGQGSIG
jgi:hypothetical protein